MMLHAVANVMRIAFAVGITLAVGGLIAKHFGEKRARTKDD